MNLQVTVIFMTWISSSKSQGTGGQRRELPLTLVEFFFYLSLQIIFKKKIKSFVGLSNFKYFCQSWWGPVLSGLLLLGISILQGFHANPGITLATVGFGSSFGVSHNPWSVVPQVIVLAMAANPLFLCLLSFNSSSSIQLVPFAPISAIIVSTSSSFEG